MLDEEGGCEISGLCGRKGMEETEKGLGGVLSLHGRWTIECRWTLECRCSTGLPERMGKVSDKASPALKHPQGGGTRAQCQLDGKEMKFLACSPARVTFPGPCSGRTRACAGLHCTLPQTKWRGWLLLFACGMGPGAPPGPGNEVKAGLLQKELACTGRTHWRNNCQLATPKAYG